MSKEKYETHVKPRLLEVAMWCRNGYTEKEIAKNLGVPYSSFREYKKKYSALLGTLAETKSFYNAQIEAALRKRVLGYSYKEETTERVYDELKGEHYMAVTKVVTKEIPPDVAAIKFTAINRMPELYSEKQDLNLDIKKVVVMDDI